MAFPQVVSWVGEPCSQGWKMLIEMYTLRFLWVPGWGGSQPQQVFTLVGGASRAMIMM